jgi:hypothetical protein
MKKSRFNNSQKVSEISIISLVSTFNSATQSDMITLEELRSFPGFEKIEPKEADKIIQSLYQLSLLTYKIIN